MDLHCLKNMIYFQRRNFYQYDRSSNVSYEKEFRKRQST